MNAGKNRKRDLELLSEVYSEAMGYAGGRGSVNTQPGAGGTGDYDDKFGQITQQAMDQNPLENDEDEERYEGEEESQQEKSAKQLSADGWYRGNADPKGNLLFRKSFGGTYADTAEVDTDGQINGMPSQEFFRQTGTQENEAEDAEDFGSPNSNRSGWGSDAFSHPGSNETTDEDEGGILDVGDCEDEPGKIDVVINPASAHGIRDILKGIFSSGDEDQEDGFDDFKNAPDTDAADKKEFEEIDPPEWEKAEQAGWNPPGRMKHKYPFDPENEEDTDEYDETENRRNLSAQDRVAKEYGFNPDENAEDTDKYDTNLFKHLDKRNTDEAEKQGFDPGLKNVRHSDEDEVDREKRYEDRWGKDLDDEKDREGSSNAGEYTNVDKDEFCGPSGGAADGTYPVNTRKRAEAAKRLAHNAPNPKGIKKCADRALAKDSYKDYNSIERILPNDSYKNSYYSSKGDRAITQITESYEQVLKNELL